jgi:hypothetical protein
LRVSKESHSGPAPPQLLNKSEAEKHHKTNDCSFLSSFIGTLTMLPYPRRVLRIADIDKPQFKSLDLNTLAIK